MIDRFNTWLALRITNSVSTMWCAYVFAFLALISLPEAIKGGSATLIAWIAQTFLQLVLLSVIMVGQRVQSLASDERAELIRQVIIETHDIAVEDRANMIHLLEDLHSKINA